MRAVFSTAVTHRTAAGRCRPFDFTMPGFYHSTRTRRSGGTGRRAGFRSQWAQARGGSSPPFGMRTTGAGSRELGADLTRCNGSPHDAGTYRSLLPAPYYHAEGGTRTPTGLRPLAPEASASTSSTTSATEGNGECKPRYNLKSTLGLTALKSVSILRWPGGQSLHSPQPAGAT